MQQTVETKIPAVVIFGATACGKTDFALSVFGSDAASQLAGWAEIVNADSIQVYADSVIASARPTHEQLKRLPHHLVGIKSGTEEFSVSDFVQAADKACLEIYSRAKMPVVTGGSAFFLKHFLTGLPKTPGADPATRLQLQNRLKAEGEASIFSELQKADPVSAAKINPHDHYRVLRALEVFYASGTPLSSFTLEPAFREHYDFLVLTLTRPKDLLYKRINERVEKMFDGGLVTEVENLLAKGMTAQSPLMKAIGYSEFFLDGEHADFENLPEVKRLIQRDTRRYAKRQETFFKTIPAEMTVDMNDPAAVTALIDCITRFFVRHFNLVQEG